MSKDPCAGLCALTDSALCIDIARAIIAAGGDITLEHLPRQIIGIAHRARLPVRDDCGGKMTRDIIAMGFERSGWTLAARLLSGLSRSYTPRALASQRGKARVFSHLFPKRAKACLGNKCSHQLMSTARAVAGTAMESVIG